MTVVPMLALVLSLPSGPGEPAAVVGSDAVVARAIAVQDLTVSTRVETDAIVAAGTRDSFVQAITVTDAWDRSFVVPDFTGAGVDTSIKPFGVPRGGSSGSPSFDVVTRTYWWDLSR